MTDFYPPINYVVVGKMRFDLAYNLNYAVKKPTAIELERFTEFHHQDMLLNFVRKTKGAQSTVYEKSADNFGEKSKQWRREARSGEEYLYYIVLSYATPYGKIKRVPIYEAVRELEVWKMLASRFDVCPGNYNWRCDPIDREIAQHNAAAEKTHGTGDTYVYFVQATIAKEQLVNISHSISLKQIDTLKGNLTFEAKVLGVIPHFNL